MGQQSQAQAQAQISALQQQNAMLNQNLHTQAQSHINHLQQLIPFHQPPHQPPPTPPPVQSATAPTVPQAPDPPAPITTPANQQGSSAPFNPDEMLQQMKSTVESSIQAMVEKTQERQVYHTPPPSHHEPTSSHPPGHHSSSIQQPPPRQRSSRRSRSKHHESPTRRHDKRPVSIHSRPRRRPRSRRPRYSSRTRSFSRSPTRRGIGHHLDIVRDPSLSNLLHLIATVNAHPLRIFNSHWTNLQSGQFFRLLPGGLANNPRGTMTQRMALIILSSPPVTSGNHGANGRTTPTTLLPHTNALGNITNNLPTVMPLPHTTPPTNHSPHFLHQ